MKQIIHFSQSKEDTWSAKKIAKYIGADELNLKELIENGYAHSSSNLESTRIFGKVWLGEKDGECFSRYEQLYKQH